MAIVMAFGVEAILPAFDEIDRSFGFSRQDVSVSLLVTTLLIGMGVGQLVWGPVSDTFGRVPVLLAGLGLYALGAVGMILAPNLELLLLSRFVWGVGAAAPNGLRIAVARDIFSGDQMARVVTFATAVFLIGPVVMPFFGEGILLLGDWELIALVGVGLAGAAAGVAIWFGETLPSERRRPLKFKPLMVALRQIVRTPASAGAILAAMFYGGAFFIFLGSAQPIIENIYDSGDQFVWLFGLSGLAMSVALFSNGRLITRFGAARVAWVAAAVFRHRECRWPCCDIGSRRHSVAGDLVDLGVLIQRRQARWLLRCVRLWRWSQWEPLQEPPRPFWPSLSWVLAPPWQRSSTPRSVPR